ncbi:MAG: inorganic phosphate transporter [Fibrobacterota bacterium]|nr:inorganic phosphate transporter [Fibrobacterota bacterium]QQS05060.1 MAG: inorganic phosphate transporter [Fibrobacterota bacterium]
MPTALILIVVLALVFDCINGMHDAANAIATGISTRAIPPRAAVIGAALFNFLGAFVSTAVAKTIGGDIADATILTTATVASALVAAIVWNIFTWAKGIPSSSSHALIGGIIGAAVAAKGFVALKPEGIFKILKALVLSPLIGFGIGFLVMVAMMWIFRRATPGKLNRRFKVLQWGSASFLAISHGSNDAQKSMGIIAMAMVSAGMMDPKNMFIPLWVKISCAAAMAIGTSSGGWRIIKTMGGKMIKLQPVNGFAAELTSSAVILSASTIGVPVSTTHCISGAIMGVGSSKRLSAVRWDVAGKMLWTWVLTIPTTAIIGYALESVLVKFL